MAANAEPKGIDELNCSKGSYLTLFSYFLLFFLARFVIVVVEHGLVSENVPDPVTEEVAPDATEEYIHLIVIH